MSERIVIERRIAGPPEKVWQFISSPDRWLAWRGTAAQIEPISGGVHRVNIKGDGFASGEVVEVVPNERISFTWGFETPGHPLPAGSTLVVIDLIPDADGASTLLRLTQERVTIASDAVARGWEHYLDRLVVVAEGGDPGRDPNLQSLS
jgi:uncharacterized protein YndB with AHSA1/START domain